MSSAALPNATRHYLGYDPGGRRANGVAILSVTGGLPSYKTAIADSVDAALAWFEDQVTDISPTAIGIDTYLFWETGPQGWRAADLWLRAEYPAVRNSIFSTNSAFGSMAVQGMSLALAARSRWPDIDLIEAHPKVLYYARAKLKYDWPGSMSDWLRKEAGLSVGPELESDHEWDALISAWAAYQGSEGNWPRDLRALSKHAVEPALAVAYWWPE